jgi:PAS domain S-box-containing protein
MTTAVLEPNFRALFEAAPALLLALQPDAPRYTIIAVSDAYLRATATKREEIVGRSLLEVFPSDRSDPGEPRDLRASLEAVVGDRAVHSMATRRYDVPRPPEVGGGAEERWWRPVNASVIGPDGDLAFIVCRVDDVTELVRLEDAADEREARAFEARAHLASLIEKAPDAIFVADVEGRCVEVSEAACRMLGYSRAEIIGRTVLDFAAPEDVEDLSRRRAQLREKGGSHSLEQRLRRKDGTLVAVEVRGTVLPDGRRQHIVRDITERKRTERERQRLAAVMRNSDDAITLQDLQGNILAWNRGAERMYGYTEAEALRMNVAELVPVGEERTLDYLQAVARGEDCPPREVRRRTKDGEIVETWLTITKIVEDGHPVAVATITRDLTQRDELDRDRLLELEVLERLYKVSSAFFGDGDRQAVFDQLLEAAIAVGGADFGNIQVLDPEASILEIVAHRGFSASWVKYWKRVSTGHGVCGTALGRCERVVVEDVANSPIFAGKAELEIQLKAGVRTVVSTPLVGRSGAPVGMISIHYRVPQRPSSRVLRLLDLLALRAAEIIERMEIEAALRRSEAKASGILMTSVEAIICIDRGRRITEWNKGAETIFGYPRGEAIGAPLDMLIPQRYLGAHREHVANFALEAEVARRMDHETTVGLRKNGEEFPLSAKISKLVIDGELIMTVSLRDISEERGVLNELRRAIQARDEVLGIVAHDLRNPLNSLVLQAQLFRRRGSEPERRSQKPTEAIVHAAMRMSRIISDLLDVTRLDAGHFAIEREAVPAAQIVAEVVELERLLVASRSLELRLDLAENLPEISADKHRICQVFENLVGNATRFTTRGSITIGAKPGPNEVLFSVADTGGGIPPDQVPHLFERFWQAPTATRGGAGLGLAIVKGIVEAHGGRVWVESRLGTGSTFFFTLPVARPVERGVTAVPAPAAAPPGESEPGPTNHTVLLAEDDPDVREALAEALWSDGYDVVAVANGAEALEHLRRQPPPSSVILDLTMPVVDGWKFLAERSRDPRLLAIPVIVVSAQQDVEDRVKAAHARHIPKPIPVDELLAMLKGEAPAVMPDLPSPPAT